MSSFRFRDLPREIRDKIYEEYFCKFKPRPTSVDPAKAFDFEPAHDGQETAILRTSRAIHHETYGILVKTNRFIKIPSDHGVPLRMVLNGVRVPMVAWSKSSVNNFKGYVLAVYLNCTKPIHPDDAPKRWSS